MWTYSILISLPRTHKLAVWTYLSSFALPGNEEPSSETSSFEEHPTLQSGPGGKLSVHLYGSAICVQRCADGG